MTRTPYDQFAKQLLAGLLDPFGEVEIGMEVGGEVQEVDLWFKPVANPTQDPQPLGLLGRMATSACLLEPYRNPVDASEIRACLLKLLLVCADCQRQARRESQTVPELPRLWILSPAVSQNVLAGFKATPDPQWGEGIHWLGESLRTAIVALSQLPANPDTLSLRLLGRGSTQQQAIEEVLALPRTSSFRENTLELLIQWRVTILIRENDDEIDEETLMKLSQVYLEWKEKERREIRAELLQDLSRELFEQARQEVLTETGTEVIRRERTSIIESLLRIRFGDIDAELSSIIEPLITLSPEEFTPLLLQLSKEELLRLYPNPPAN